MCFCGCSKFRGLSRGEIVEENIIMLNLFDSNGN